MTLRDISESKHPIGCPEWVRVWEDGHVEYLSGAGNTKRFRRKPRVSIGKNGYAGITLSVNGKCRRVYVHRLVLLAFNWFKGCEAMDVNHKNGIRIDNNRTNLEWCTRAQNNLHKYRVLGRSGP